jgi:hypothetical protein
MDRGNVQHVVEQRDAAEHRKHTRGGAARALGKRKQRDRRPERHQHEQLRSRVLALIE